MDDIYGKHRSDIAHYVPALSMWEHRRFYVISLGNVLHSHVLHFTYRCKWVCISGRIDLSMCMFRNGYGTAYSSGNWNTTGMNRPSDQEVNVQVTCSLQGRIQDLKQGSTGGWGLAPSQNFWHILRNNLEDDLKEFVKKLDPQPLCVYIKL